MVRAGGPESTGVTDHRPERQRPYQTHHQGKRGYRRQQAEKGDAEGHP